jgi:hypothetical protein
LWKACANEHERSNPAAWAFLTGEAVDKVAPKAVADQHHLLIALH